MFNSTTKTTTKSYDASLYHFLIDTIKKHCVLYNFNLIKPTSTYADIVAAYEQSNSKQAPWKVCTQGVAASTCTVAAINTKTHDYDVLVIKMLDVLFSEILKLENYVLKINSTVIKDQEALCDMLAFHAVSFVCDPSLSKTFIFSSKDLTTGDTSFCIGSCWSTSNGQLCIGAEISIDSLELLTQSTAHKLKLPQAPALHVIVPEHTEHSNGAFFVAQALQAQGLAVDILFNPAPLAQRLAQAKQLGAKHILVMSPDNIANGTISVINGISGSKHTCRQEDIVNFLLGR